MNLLHDMYYEVVFDCLFWNIAKHNLIHMPAHIPMQDTQIGYRLPLMLKVLKYQEPFARINCLCEHVSALTFK